MVKSKAEVKGRNLRRVHKSILIAGGLCTGKSTEALKLLLKAVEGDESRGVLPRKALILDRNDEYAQKDIDGKIVSIKAIDLADVKKLKENNICEIRRVLPYKDGKRMTKEEFSETADKILHDFKESDGIILFDSCDYLKSQQMKVLPTVGRQFNVDLVFVTQSIEPTLLDYCAFIQLHHTKQRINVTYSDQCEMTAIASNIVDYYANNVVDIETEKVVRDGNRYFSLWMDLNELRIIGVPHEYGGISAVRTYLSQYLHQVIQPLENDKQFMIDNGIEQPLDVWQFMLTKLQEKYFHEEEAN